MMRLYKFVESCLPDNYETVTRESMDEDKHGVVGIFFYDSRDDEDCMDATLWKYVKAQVQVAVKHTEDNMAEVIDYLESFVRNIESKIDSGDKSLCILGCKHIGMPAKKIKINEQMIAMWESVINIQYNYDEE